PAGPPLALVAPAIPEADEQWNRHPRHHDVRDHDTVDRPAVDRLEREAAALGGDPGGGVRRHGSVELAIGNDYQPEIACALAEELEAVRRAAHPAVRHQHVLGAADMPEREARLQAEGVVARLDVAVRDADAAAAVRVDAVGVSGAAGDAVEHDAGRRRLG